MICLICNKNKNADNFSYVKNATACLRCYRMMPHPRKQPVRKIKNPIIYVDTKAKPIIYKPEIININPEPIIINRDLESKSQPDNYDHLKPKTKIVSAEILKNLEMLGMTYEEYLLTKKKPISAQLL